MAAGMVVSILLGRTIGPTGLGIISLANQVAGFALIFIIFGLDKVLIKEIAIAYEKADEQRIADVIYTSRIIMVILASVISVAGLIFLDKIVDLFNEPQLKIPMSIAFVIMNVQIHSRIYASGINGYRKIWQSNLVNDTLSTIFVLFALLISLVLKIELTVVHIAVYYAIGRIIVFITIRTYWYTLYRFKRKPIWAGKNLLKTAFPLLLFSATYMIASHADTIMLGWLSTTDEVGYYNVAFRLGSLTNILLVISISVLMPKIASLYAEKRNMELQIMVQNVTKGLIGVGFASVIFFILLGKPILSLWGEKFLLSYYPLIIIASGQFINVATGSTGVILMMSGHEKILGIITLISALANVTLNYFLIVRYGALGAAMASAITVSSENIIKVFIVQRKTGIMTLPIKVL